MTPDRMTAAEYRAALSAPNLRKNKYGAIPAFRCGLCGTEHVIRFDSRAEARRWDKLQQMLGQGLISALRRQVPFAITMEDKTVATYYLDYQYLDAKGVLHHEDLKGGRATRTAVSRLKIKLVEAQYGITVEIVA